MQELVEGLTIAKWAIPLHQNGDSQSILVDLLPDDLRLKHSPASGHGLVSNGQLGVDRIQLEAGDGFAPHVHPGDHILIVVGGQGTITFDGRVYPTEAGEVYMVDGEIPHAVGAITRHTILAVGAPHKPVDSLERMTPVEYSAVLTDVGDMSCLICKLGAVDPVRLHDHGCPHCPCHACTSPVVEDRCHCDFCESRRLVESAKRYPGVS